MNPLKQWRYWLLVLLLVGPILAYMGLGMLWLWEHGWVVLGDRDHESGSLAGIALLHPRRPMDQFASTRSCPPLDWESPQTFSPLDRDAWKIVQEAAEEGETISLRVLDGPGHVHEHREETVPPPRRPLSSPGDQPDRRRAASRAADGAGSGDRGPVAALPPGAGRRPGHALALADGGPGGRLHLQGERPVLVPACPSSARSAGLARWGSREWIVKPAWKNMQQNMLRWFYQAYVNRLGAHLIELLSGRLVIGADQYRRLTRRSHAGVPSAGEDVPPLTICVAGTADSGKSRLISALREAGHGDLTLLKARLSNLAIEPVAGRPPPRRGLGRASRTTRAGPRSRAVATGRGSRRRSTPPSGPTC